MKNSAALILATVAALLSIVGALLYSNSPAKGGVLSLLTLLLALLGLLGLIAVVAAIRERGRKGLHGAAIICGSLIALACNTVMSIGPLAGGAAFTLALSIVVILLSSNRSGVRLLILTLGFTAVVSFGVLFSIVMSTELERVSPPDSSAILRALPGYHYEDSFRVNLSTDVRPEIRSIVEAFSISLRPWWLRIPNRGAFGQVAIEPGTALGGWDVHEISPSEIIIGLDRSFIDLRISLFVAGTDEPIRLTATTVARYNDWRGRLYFVPVRLGHQIVLADTLRRMAFLLQEDEAEKKLSKRNY